MLTAGHTLPLTEKPIHGNGTDREGKASAANDLLFKHRSKESG
jgi:hypothetical protein